MRCGTIFSIVLVAGLLMAVTNAQAPPTTVEAAEAEGAKHPKAVAGTEQAMYADAFGPTDRRCVDADAAKHTTARSGEFVAGPFDRPVFMGNPRSPEGSRRKVWWTPRQGTAMPPMRFRAAKIDAPNVTVNWSFPSVVRNENGQFYNTLFRFPEIGKWLVVITAGNNWGCFLLDEIDLSTLENRAQAIR